MVPGKHQQPDVSNNISNPQTSSSRSCLILLLGDQMANFPLLSIFFLVATWLLAGVTDRFVDRPCRRVVAAWQWLKE